MLVHQSPATLERDHGRHPNLGVLSSPRRVYRNVDGWRWAADNDAYSDWDEGRYREMLKAIKGIPGCLFVTAPDVVGDARATSLRFEYWRKVLDSVGQPIAYVGQDGATSRDVPWHWIDAFFIGGTTLWKMSDEAAALAREAKEEHRKWLHMGRVNTTQRIRYAQSLGCDSIDGTAFSMYRDRYLPSALSMNASGRQLGLSDRPTR